MFNFEETYAIVNAELELQRLGSLQGAKGVLHVPLILGPVGSGKTALAHKTAQARDLPLQTVNCGECTDGTEFGIPHLKDDAMQWALGPQLQAACETASVLFFDDLDKAPKLVQGLLLSIIGERTVRGRLLHEQTLLLCAGNRTQDDILAHQLSESMRTRATPIEYVPTLADFSKYAADSGTIAAEVLGFLTYKPELLHAHDPDALRFPTPRGWEEGSNLIHSKSMPAARAITLKCGKSAGAEFSAWYQIVAKLDIDTLLAGNIDRKTYTAVYASIFAVAGHLRGCKRPFVPDLMPFVTALRPEERVAFLYQLPQTHTGNLPTDVAALLAEAVVK